jgi:hypothetical protein
MSADSSHSEADALVEGSVLEEQMDACDEIITDIMRPDDRLDPTDEENIFNKINLQYDRATSKTKQVLADRHESVGLNTAFKTLIEGIIEERGFLEKLGRSGRYDDDLKTVTRWFKLYATVVLDDYQEISYEFALVRFKEYRDEVIEHPQGGIPAATDKPEASLLGFLTLSWAAIEDILQMWSDLLSMDTSDVSDHEDELDGQYPKYGFIHNLRDSEGYVTTFYEAQEGKDTWFDPELVRYFPEEGDIVKLTDWQDEKNNGRPRDTLTANFVQRYDLKV